VAGIDSLQPDLAPWAHALIDAAGDAGLVPRLTSARRTHAEQQRLYRRFLAGQQPYPVARPGTSAHEFGWAFDLVLSPMDALADAGALWESWGGVWGGHPRRAGSGYDPVHFEWPGWRQLVTQEEYAEAARQTDEGFGIFPFSAPSPAQRKGLTIAQFIPGTAGILATLSAGIVDYLYPEEK